MYELSAFMTGIYNRCLDHAERSPRWHGFAISGIAALGFFVILFLAPTWVFAGYYVFVIGPVQVYMYAHSKVWRKRDEIRKGQFAKTMKTRKLLKGNRFDK